MHPISNPDFLGIICLVLIGSLGIIAHILLNVRALRRQTANLVIDISLKKYLKDEWDNISLSFLALIILGAVWTEVVEHASSFSQVAGTVVMNLAKLTFIAVGLCGDFIIFRLYGKTSAAVNKEIDRLAMGPQPKQQTENTPTQPL